MKRIVFVAGYGRSGSTLIERILNASEQVFAAGEMKFMLTEATRHGVYEESPIWSRVKSDLDASDQFGKCAEGVRAEFETIPSGLFKYPMRRFFRSAWSNYVSFTNASFAALSKYIPESCDWIIDSSKTGRDSFLRPQALRAVTGKPIKMLHVVRDPRGCYTSILKGSNRRMERGQDPELSIPFIRTCFSWNLANIGAHLYGVFHSKDYMRVRYEDYVAEPRRELERISEFLGVSFESAILALENETTIPVADQVYGNRMRKDTTVRLRSDTSWRASVSVYIWWALTLVNLIPLCFYGYPLGKNGQ